MFAIGIKVNNRVMYLGSPDHDKFRYGLHRFPNDAKKFNSSQEAEKFGKDYFTHSSRWEVVPLTQN
ncbi:hypothetical protein [Schleiferilactobacillus perolens]|jgi:hypothetical protein|uniref:Uncharacterized protein n=1 Tax=Schleiferilactobacillus perolens DSM 12744 TaxID=1423792 RepID=A0A0R1MRU3_9LACO|nr:hypothetical protein [Schleiferilactobacillus perolens]KRL10767.1 hypothetical protein FD09_GL000913 [Schleiferilactobacillus perolens DSM 12744]MCI1892334.1 hypothetical protein [Schleiferilactobacillus harbinensis]MCI1913741.1 hypothetical protein [Schleiferilactobacillus harbinensis]MCI2171562.1 hypothetical protein [Schleiferilactobacillus perolens]